MNTIVGKIKEIENRFRFEPMTKRLSIVIKTELTVFIRDIFIKIDMDEYFEEDSDVDAANSVLKLEFKQEFKDKMLKHYPEEFI